MTQQLLAQLADVLEHGHAGASLTDGQLLEQFLARRDEAAFAALVRRHGPMVLGVCRRVLGNDADAEDAFQATFIVLVRKGAALTARAVLGAWLHGVAQRTALKARAADLHRRAKEQAAARPEVLPAETPLGNWLLLDQELARLPEKYRLPIVLCDLEDRTRREAATLLGWPEGTVAARLARGRKMLAGRLLRGAAPLSGVVTAGVASSTAQAAVQVVAGRAQSVLSARVLTLVEGVMQSMSWNKLTIGVLALLVLVAAGVGGLTFRLLAGEGLQKPADVPDRRTSLVAPDVPGKGPPGKDEELLQGTWVVVESEIAGRKIAAAELKARPRTVVFHNQRVRVVEAAREDPRPFQLGEGTYQLAGKKSRTLDITYGDFADRFPGPRPPGVPQPTAEGRGTVLAIYDLTGDQLRICFGGLNAARPKEFATRPGAVPAEVLLVLRRKPAEAPPDPKQPPDKPDPKKPAEPAEAPPINLVKAATSRVGFPAEGYPVLPSLSTEMRGQVCNEIHQSAAVRAAYQKLNVAGRRNVDWFEGVTGLEKEKAVWCLLSCLCHPSEDVQINALRSLERVKDKRAVPFLLLYADYMAVFEDGSENATIHGVIHQSVAKTLSTLTTIEVVLKGQDPEGLKKGIKRWNKWLVQEEK